MTDATTVLDELVKAKESIKRKYIALKTGSDNVQQLMTQTLKPIIDPLTKISNKPQNVSIRSFNHQLMTIKTKKLTYNSYDDKRVVLEDKIHTLAHGHYSIEEDEPEDEWPELDYEVDDRGRRLSKLDKEFMRELLCYTTK
ncbi:uncharacterized protein LOC132950630 [Metopolophium dirhodum]|uniref:uncharacterized protein LOC132950630 n=1 Tax=Metopolophium dirhodum TaxID=44670 RepID=UPI0029901138|nr:uncharacterized protein LOC132950630 [Metopolophium dirhodum]